MNQFSFSISPRNTRLHFKTAYKFLGEKTEIPKILIASYFGDARPNIDAIKGLPVAGFHYDFVRVPEQIDDAIDALTEKQILSVGIVDGRNIWKDDSI